MKRYREQSRISPAAALGAALATAATIGIAVLVPAKLPQTEASMMAAKHPAVEVAIVPPARIEVIGYRTARSATEPALVQSAPDGASVGARKS